MGDHSGTLAIDRAVERRVTAMLGKFVKNDNSLPLASEPAPKSSTVEIGISQFSPTSLKVAPSSWLTTAAVQVVP